MIVIPHGQHPKFKFAQYLEQTMVFSRFCVEFVSCNISLKFEQVEYSGFQVLLHDYMAHMRCFVANDRPMVGTYKVIAVPYCKSFNYI